jgi:hypothetical protein
VRKADGVEWLLPPAQALCLPRYGRSAQTSPASKNRECAIAARMRPVVALTREYMLALSRMGVIIAPSVADERPSMMSNFVGSGL